MIKTNALAIRENSTIATKATDIDVFRLGEVLVKSGYFQDTRDASQAVVKILYGQEIGLSPIASMSAIHIVKGKPILSATAIAGAIKRKNSPYDYKVIEHSDKVCSLEFYENGEKVGDSVFSVADAKTAGLTGDNWTKFPKNMLFARAISNGAKWFCADIFGGTPIYTPEEIETETVKTPTHQPSTDAPKFPTKGELIEKAKQTSESKEAPIQAVSVEAEFIPEGLRLSAVIEEIKTLLTSIGTNPALTISKISSNPEKAGLALHAVRKTVITKVLEADNGWDAENQKTYFTPFGFAVLKEATLEQTGAVIADLRKNKML